MTRTIKGLLFSALIVSTCTLSSCSNNDETIKALEADKLSLEQAKADLSAENTTLKASKTQLIHKNTELKTKIADLEAALIRLQFGDLKSIELGDLKSIELGDLIKLFSVAETARYNSFSWKHGANEPAIEWKEGFQDGNCFGAAHVFNRQGEVMITIDGKPMTRVIAREEPATWTIQLCGARSGFVQANLRKPFHAHGVAIHNWLNSDGVESELIACETSHVSDGANLYSYKVDGHKGWLFLEWSCGSAGCGENINLYTIKPSLSSFPKLAPERCP